MFSELQYRVGSGIIIEIMHSEILFVSRVIEKIRFALITFLIVLSFLVLTQTAHKNAGHI